MKSLNEVIRDTKIAITEVVSDGKKTWTCKNEKGESISGELGYKVFNPNWTCRGGFQYEVGKSFVENLKPCLCTRSGATQGMHYCVQAADCFNYYSFSSDNKVALVLAYGDVDGNVNENKRCTNKLFIIREIPWCELLELVNAGKDNTGRCNTGDGNTGDHNTGSHNTGGCNTGYHNTGNCNTGHHNTGGYNTGDINTGSRNTGNRNAGDINTGDGNTGDHNTGNCNAGDHNTGNCNAGNYNTGYHNTGNYNTGYHNTGNYNTGYHNTGACNTGNWNAGNYNTGDFNIVDDSTGCFCTEVQTIRMFDQNSNMTLQQWRNSEAYQILQKAKANGPKCYIQWWGKLNTHQRNVIKNIPNFNADKFKFITGIDVNDETAHTSCYLPDWHTKAK